MRLAIVAAAVLTLAGCASLEVRTLQTLAQANATVTAAEQTAHTLYLSGAIDKAKVRQVAVWVDKADDWSLSARCAYAKADLSTTAGYIGAILGAAEAISANLNDKMPPVVPQPSAIVCPAPAPLASVMVPASLVHR